MIKTMHPIMHDKLPLDRKFDVTNYNPTTKEKIIIRVRTFRVRGVAGGDRINYAGVVSLQLVKTLRRLLSTIFFLLRADFIRIFVPILPDDNREAFKLDQYIHNRFVLFEVTKSMYGLSQAGYFAQKELVDYLANYDYFPSATDPCLFRHKTNGLAFTLVVDVFLIKYKELVSAIPYSITRTLPLVVRLGIDIAFDKRKRTVKLSIPSYIPKMLCRFNPDRVGLVTTPCIYEPPIKGI